MKKDESPVESKETIDTASLKALLEIGQKNLALNEEILAKVKYVKRYIFWKKVFSVTVWILIIASTVASLLYLPPLIRNLQDQIQTVTPGLLGF